MRIPTTRVPIRVPGFRFAGVHCGLKESGKRDVALIASEVPAVAVAAFTTNLAQSAAVIVGQAHVRSGRLQAIVVNSGNANAFTGRGGVRLTRELCGVVARALRIRADLVLPSATGRIGIPLPRPRVLRGVRAACEELAPEAFYEALEGMMTTDAFPKVAAETAVIGDREVVIAGMAKGAGMIAPRMTIAGGGHATLLSYILTDAAVSRPALRRCLAVGLPQSFNAIVVDGDTSTSDTVVLMANGQAGHRPLTPASRDFPSFCAAVGRVMRQLARLVVKDGEGATKVVDIAVRGARTVADADRVADAIARSPLCKAAFYGNDPYTGRIVCAAGYSGARFDPNRLDIYVDGVCVARRGHEIITPGIERRAAAVVARPEFTLTVDLHAGRAVAHRMASDLTVDYVRFNSDYRT